MDKFVAALHVLIKKLYCQDSKEHVLLANQQHTAYFKRMKLPTWEYCCQIMSIHKQGGWLSMASLVRADQRLMKTVKLAECCYGCL